MVRGLIEDCISTGPDRFFTQNDAYGDAGWKGAITHGAEEFWI